MRTILILMTAAAVPSAASAQPVPGTALGTEPAAVAAALKSQGFALQSFERERSRIELVIDARAGKLVRAEREDD